MTDIFDLQAQAASIHQRAAAARTEAERIVRMGHVPILQRKLKAGSVLDAAKLPLKADQKKLIQAIEDAKTERANILAEIHPPATADRERIEYARQVVLSQLAGLTTPDIINAFSKAIERGDKIEIAAYALEAPQLVASGTSDKGWQLVTKSLLEKAQPFTESTRQRNARLEIEELQTEGDALRRSVMGAIAALDHIPDIPKEEEVW